jgi:hypothetical protein
LTEPAQTQDFVEVFSFTILLVASQDYSQRFLVYFTYLTQYNFRGLAPYEEILTYSRHVGHAALDTRRLKIHQVRLAFIVYDYVFWCSTEFTVVQASKVKSPALF